MIGTITDTTSVGENVGRVTSVAIGCNSSTCLARIITNLTCSDSSIVVFPSSACVAESSIGQLSAIQAVNHHSTTGFTGGCVDGQVHSPSIIAVALLISSQDEESVAADASGSIHAGLALYHARRACAVKQVVASSTTSANQRRSCASRTSTPACCLAGNTSPITIALDSVPSVSQCASCANCC